MDKQSKPTTRNSGLWIEGETGIELVGKFNSKHDKSSWKGQQTLITPKGRETFRLLLK